jgi:AcrR family transcriptional regulator
MPRRYDRSGRDAAMARTRARIVDAIVALHAERGAGDTSYADIAARADVAIPTVYKHFPSLETMFAACVGHVSERAPPLAPELFAGLTGAADRLAALARALAARHRYFQPWLRWRAHAPAQLAVHHRRMDEALRMAVRQAVAPAFTGEPPPALIGLLATLLDFRAWQMLAVDHGLSDSAAAEAIANAARLVLGGYTTP